MKALYVTPSTFRVINAGALRNLNIANALALGGHTVTLLTGDGPEDVKSSAWEGLSEPGVTMRSNGASRAGRLSRLRRAFAGNAIDPKMLKSIDAVVAYNPGPLQYLRLRRATRAQGIRLVVDISEWFSQDELPGSWFSPYSWLYEVFMRTLPPMLGRGGRALAISSPMAAWLSSRGGETLVVPPLSAVRPHGNKQSNDIRRIVLSGSGISKGGKDAAALELLISLAESGSEALRDTEFNVLGRVDQHTSRRLVELADRVSVVEHGWLEWKQALEVAERADWMLLLRDPTLRRHRLGYPSKVIESLNLGVPVIVNVCGGTTDYLQEGTNAVIARGVTAECLSDALRRARPGLSPTAEARFIPSEWTKRLSSFLFN
ncbi:MAG TPA: hypothetical protein DIW46_08245 [Microbacterium sp.]|nr:hypothetical protein [Microbacterium sp.]